MASYYVEIARQHQQIHVGAMHARAREREKRERERDTERREGGVRCSGAIRLQGHACARRERPQRASRRLAGPPINRLFFDEFTTTYSFYPPPSFFSPSLFPCLFTNDSLGFLKSAPSDRKNITENYFQSGQWIL